MPNYLIEVHNKSHNGEKPTYDYWKVVNSENAKAAAKQGWKEICSQFDLVESEFVGINRSRSWGYINEEIQNRLRFNNSIEEFIFPLWNGKMFLKPRKPKVKR